MLLAFLAGCTGTLVTRSLGPVFYPSAVFELDNRSCTLALTIDDGPHLHTTRDIARVLERHHAHATFFVIGSRVDHRTWPVLESLVREGHEVASHGWTEARAIFQPRREFEREVIKAHEVLEELARRTGSKPSRWFRPGWALYNSAMLDFVSAAPFNYRIALGDVFPGDTRHCSVGRSSRFVLAQVRRGSVIVLHDADTTRVLSGARNRCKELRGARTAAVLDRVLPALKARGFRIDTLSNAAAAPEGSDADCG